MEASLLDLNEVGGGSARASHDGLDGLREQTVERVAVGAKQGVSVRGGFPPYFKALDGAAVYFDLLESDQKVRSHHAVVDHFDEGVFLLMLELRYVVPACDVQIRDFSEVVSSALGVVGNELEPASLLRENDGRVEV